MAFISVTHNFTNRTKFISADLNQNFTDMVNGTSDGTKDVNASTGDFTDLDGGLATVTKNLTCADISATEGAFAGDVEIAGRLTGKTHAYPDTNSETFEIAVGASKTIAPTTSRIYLKAERTTTTFDTITIDADNNTFEITESDGVRSLVTVANGTYNGTTLAAAVETAMNATLTNTYTVVFTTIFTIRPITGGNLFVLWTDGGNYIRTSCLPLMGFDFTEKSVLSNQKAESGESQIQYGKKVDTITTTALKEGSILTIMPSLYADSGNYAPVMIDASLLSVNTTYTTDIALTKGSGLQLIVKKDATVGDAGTSLLFYSPNFSYAGFI